LSLSAINKFRNGFFKSSELLANGGFLPFKYVVLSKNGLGDSKCKFFLFF
jgi:hypothetical protein